MSHACQNWSLTLQEKKDLVDLIAFINWTKIYVPLGLSIFGLLFTSVFFFVAIIGVKRRKLALHFYCCLINRSLADMICALALIVTLITAMSSNQRNEKIASTVLDVSTTIIYATLFEATFTLLTLLTLKMFAIKWPLRYKRRVTQTFIVRILTISWPLSCIVTLLISIPSIIAWMRPTHVLHDCWLLFRSAAAWLSYILPSVVFFTALLLCVYVVCMVKSAGRIKLVSSLIH